MRISGAGIELIRHHEGLRLTAYRDPVGVLTIGYGHTGPDVTEGLAISAERATELLLADLAEAESAVSRLVTVPLSQQQFDALVSFTFNLGARALENSTLLRVLNAGDYADAAAQFDRWVLAGGQTLPGLVRRRAEERALFEAGIAPVAIHPPAAPAQERPMAPIVAALLPSLIGMLPELGKLFGSGSPVAERNLEAATKVAAAVVQATGAPNLQGAVEAMSADPQARQRASEAVQGMWYELVPADGGGIAGAREHNAASAEGAFWRMPAFWVSMSLLPLLYGTVYLVLTGAAEAFSGELRAAIASSVVTGVLGGVIGFWLGSSFTTSRSRGLGATPAAPPL